MKRSPTLVRRTPLPRRAGLTRRRRPIRPESDRKAVVRRDAAAARDLVRDRDDCCILCGGPGVDAHHRLPRGRGGATWDPSRFALSRLVWLCRECHRWVESRRTLAYGLGLLVRHGVTPCVACHVDGTTQADFLPGSWDHRSASYGTTRRVVTPVGRGRLFDLHVLVSGMEVADDGVPGGRRD